MGGVPASFRRLRLREAASGGKMIHPSSVSSVVKLPIVRVGGSTVTSNFIACKNSRPAASVVGMSMATLRSGVSAPARRTVLRNSLMSRRSSSVPTPARRNFSSTHSNSIRPAPAPDVRSSGSMSHAPTATGWLSTATTQVISLSGLKSARPSFVSNDETHCPSRPGR